LPNASQLVVASTSIFVRNKITYLVWLKIIWGNIKGYDSSSPKLFKDSAEAGLLNLQLHIRFDYFITSAMQHFISILFF
jgi:hypothetical protein